MLTYNRYCKYCNQVCGASTFDDDDPRDPNDPVFYDSWHTTCWEAHVKPGVSSDVSPGQTPGVAHYFHPASGKAGDVIHINIYPSYDVFFNGIKASVISASGGVDAVVPAGATTGMISIDNHFIKSDGYARGPLPLAIFTVEV